MWSYARKEHCLKLNVSYHILPKLNQKHAIQEEPRDIEEKTFALFGGLKSIGIP